MNEFHDSAQIGHSSFCRRANMVQFGKSSTVCYAMFLLVSQNGRRDKKERKRPHEENNVL